MSIYLGIDWSENKHDAMFLNDAGASLAYLSFPHSAEGFCQLDHQREQLGVPPADCLVALETAHNLLLDFLWARGYTQVYVVPPSLVKGKRQGYRPSGARTDRSDAQLLATLLRTERSQLHPWRLDSVLLRQIRAKVSLVNYLTHQVVRTSNRLRAVLLRYYPAAVGLFSDLTTQIALQFICTYPTPQQAQALSFDEFKAFVAQHRYPARAQLPRRFAHLQQPQPTTPPETVQVYQAEAVQLATLLLTVVQAKRTELRALHQLFQQHPDQAIFASLPGAGEFLAPALLAKFGEDRQRFPTAASVQALAGTCPVTDASGKRKVIRFRHSCDREFRWIAIQWARTSRAESAWASAYFEAVRPHCTSDSHAYRCLANRWLAIAWALWRNHQPYDESYHLKQRAAHSRPRG